MLHTSQPQHTPAYRLAEHLCIMWRRVLADAAAGWRSISGAKTSWQGTSPPSLTTGYNWQHIRPHLHAGNICLTAAEVASCMRRPPEVHTTPQYNCIRCGELQLIELRSMYGMYKKPLLLLAGRA